MNRLFLFILCAAVTGAAAGCRMDFNPSLKLSDVVKLCDGAAKEQASAEVTIRFEVSSEKSFEESKDRITQLLGTMVSDIKNVRCESKDYNNFYAADAKIPVYRSSQLPDDAKERVCVHAVKVKDEYRIGLYVGRDFLSTLNARIPSDFYAKVEVKDLFFSFTLTNDTGGKVSAKTYSVYVDGRPAPFVSSMSAEPDASTEIRLSEIYRDYICAEGKGFFYEFALEKKEKETPQKKETPALPAGKESGKPEAAK